MTIEINLHENASDKTCPCYFEQGGQESKAYLYLDLEGEGEMWIGSKYPSDNSWGHREHHKIQYRYAIPNNLTEVGYNQLLRDAKVLALAERVVAGAEIEWDGGNYRGALNDDAEAAEDELSRYLEQVTAADYDSLEPWDAAMWLDLSPLSSLVKDGETHEQAAERLRLEALRERAYLSAVDIEEELDRKKEREEEDAEELDTSEA